MYILNINMCTCIIIHFLFQEGTALYNLAAGTCLSVSEKKINAEVEMNICNNDSSYNKWNLIIV